MALALDDKQLELREPYELTLECKDDRGVAKSVGPQTFWAAHFVGYDLVLGYPWLAEADPCIKFSAGTFQ